MERHASVFHLWQPNTITTYLPSTFLNSYFIEGTQHMHCLNSSFFMLNHYEG